MDELLPCPFCGEANAYTTDSLEGGRTVKCGNEGCAASGPETGDATTSEAIKTWNRRAPVKTETTEDARTKETTDMKIEDMVGATFDLYGVDGNCFRLGFADGTVRTFEAVEDEDDGYRSSLAELRDVTDRPTLVFSSAPIARATGKRAPEGRDGDDIVKLVDEDGHSWLRVGTSDTDDYYPCFVFTWTPKELKS